MPALKLYKVSHYYGQFLLVSAKKKIIKPSVLLDTCNPSDLGDAGRRITSLKSILAT